MLQIAIESSPLETLYRAAVSAPIGVKPEFHARAAAFDAEREARLAYSYGLLPVPPPATVICWRCPGCGYEHVTRYRGEHMAECGCGVRRNWSAVIVEPANVAEARRLYAEWRK